MAEDIDIRASLSALNQAHGRRDEGGQLPAERACTERETAERAEEESWQQLDRQIAKACRQTARIAIDAGVPGGIAEREVPASGRLFFRKPATTVRTVVGYQLEWGGSSMFGPDLILIHPERDPEWRTPDTSEKAPLGGYCVMADPYGRHHAHWRATGGRTWVNGSWIEDQEAIGVDEQRASIRARVATVLAEFLYAKGVQP